MPALKFISLTTEETNNYRTGDQDINHQSPELLISNGSGLPCRHCLTDISENEPCLLLAYRPFPEPDPYAEIGPIFIHKDGCKPFTENSIPTIICEREQVLIRGYDQENRIIDGTGQVVKTENFQEKAEQVLADKSVEYLHVRSVSNNCYFCRVELAS